MSDVDCVIADVTGDVGGTAGGAVVGGTGDAGGKAGGGTGIAGLIANRIIASYAAPPSSCGGCACMNT